MNTILGKYLNIVSQDIPLILWNTPQRRWKPDSSPSIPELRLIMVDLPRKGSMKVVLPAASIAFE